MLNLNKLCIYFRLIRINKITGILLLLWPTYWALWLVNFGLPDFFILLVFSLGVFLMRSIGCIVNDFADRKFDGFVSRTNKRPFPMGEVTENEARLLFFLLIICAFILVLNLNKMTIYLSLIALLLTLIYPFIKRFSYFPQVILGAAFGWSIPMVYASVNQDLPLECWLLFIVNFIWSVIYDTEYAMVDRDDDIKIGIKSTAIIFAKYDKLIIGVLQLSMISLLIYIGIMLNISKYYFISLSAVLGLFIYQQILIINRKPTLCFKAFLSNVYVGLVLFIGIFLSYFN